MGRLIKWLVRKYIEREMCHETDHPQRITAMYEAIRDVAREVFYEDNDATLDGYLEERFRLAHPKLRQNVDEVKHG